MADTHSSSNSPTDFAFAAPGLSHSEGFTHDLKQFGNMSPPTQPNFAYQPFSFNPSGHAGSFSSIGSATGTSFSSADTSLPAISRDFARPSTEETRRPATAGGAFVTRPFNTAMEPPIQEETESGTIPNNQPVNSSMAALRRSSESQVPWNNLGDSFVGMNMLHQQHPSFPHAPLNTRPQTSDGVPMQSFAPSLPSALSIANQVDYRTQYRAMPMDSHNTFPGDRSYSMNGVRPSYVTPPSSAGAGSTRIAEDGSLQFVSLGGPAPKKRPRRRYDEIERLYTCGWNGCEKSYGTLNHLNAHVAMQKHGEKRLPQEFKEMRKQWRKRKREHAAATANTQVMPMNVWNRASMSSNSSSEFDRRDSAMTDFSRGSVYSNYGFTDSRPGTSGSVASTDSRPSTGYAAPPPAWGYGPGARRVSAPTHISMPVQMTAENGFRPVEGDHPTPTPQNPFPNQNGLSQNGRQYFQQPMISGSMSNSSQLAGQVDPFAFR